jgi:hypothetical protein
LPDSKDSYKKYKNGKRKAVVYFTSQPNEVCLYNNYNFDRHDYNWNFNETGVLGGIVSLGKKF